MSTGSCESTEVPLPQAGLRVGVGRGGGGRCSGRAPWRRYQLSGTLKGKDQRQVNRQRNNMGKSQEAGASLKGLFRETAEG